MVKKFTIPFASQGDANDIPDALQVDGKVSFTQGFGYDYERPYDDPQAKDIAREDMNGLFKAITSAVGELQTIGASEWSNAISYPKGAIVYYEKDLYISQVDDNQNEPPQSWVSITSIANDSLKKAANLSDLTNKTTARNNLGLGSSATLNKTDILGTSTSLVATQKLVNDTKINLESSKQDKLQFVGDGPEVMKAGAYGLGATELEEYRDTLVSGFYTDNEARNILRVFRLISKRGFELAVENATDEAYIRRFVDGWEDKFFLYTTANVTQDKNKFLRSSSSNENALTESDRTSELGTSTVLVATQKLVNDTKINLDSSVRAVDIKSDNAQNRADDAHALAEQQFGYQQTLTNVTAERISGSIYTNSTGKMIMVVVTRDANKSLNATVYRDFDNAPFPVLQLQVNQNDTGSFIVPAGYKYKVDNFQVWSELR